MQVAFAHSIIDSVGGLFKEIIDIEATEQRRRLQSTSPGTDSVDGVEISYTGVARVDGTDNAAAVSADVLEQSMDAMTLAVYDGSFLATLQDLDSAFAAADTFKPGIPYWSLEGVSWILKPPTPRAD